MGEEEVAAFARQPNLDAILRIRLLDDAGKEAGMETPAFDHFAPMVQRQVDRYCSTTS